jgi:amidase
MSELHDLSALQQGAAIAAGELSPVEITEHYLARTERLGAEVGAFITVTPELALEQARAAEAAVRDAAASGAALPPLHGVVVPVKDIDFQAGVRCTMGSAV